MGAGVIYRIKCCYPREPEYYLTCEGAPAEFDSLKEVTGVADRLNGMSSGGVVYRVVQRKEKETKDDE